MDGKVSSAQRREALDDRHRRPRSSLVWTRPGAVRTAASEGAVSRGAPGRCRAHHKRLEDRVATHDLKASRPGEPRTLQGTAAGRKARDHLEPVFF